MKKIFSVRIKGTLEAVWREITKTDEVQGVMFNMRLDSTMSPGAPIRLRSPDGKYTGIIGEILELVPQSKYVHTFKFTSYDEAPCTVIHELEEDGDEIVYRMICDDLVEGDKTTKQMTQGADLILKNLKSVVEKGRLPMSTRVLYGIFALTAPFTPKRLLSANWP